MKPDEILFLAPQDVQKLLSLQECIVAVEECFRLYGEGKAQAPPVLSMHVEGGDFYVKAGILHLKRPYFAAKINCNFPGNFNTFGLPTIQGVIVLSDGENGTPLAIMDSRDVTCLRTAAATAVAAKYLARTDSRTVTICGCGEQGRLQLRALTYVRQLQTVFAYDQRPEQTKTYAAELASELKIPVTPVTDLATFARQSDIKERALRRSGRCWVRMMSDREPSSRQSVQTIRSSRKSTQCFWRKASWCVMSLSSAR